VLPDGLRGPPPSRVPQARWARSKDRQAAAGRRSPEQGNSVPKKGEDRRRSGGRPAVGASVRVVARRGGPDGRDALTTLRPDPSSAARCRWRGRKGEAASESVPGWNRQPCTIGLLPPAVSPSGDPGHGVAALPPHQRPRHPRPSSASAEPRRPPTATTSRTLRLNRPGPRVEPTSPRGPDAGADVQGDGHGGGRERSTSRGAWLQASETRDCDAALSQLKDAGRSRVWHASRTDLFDAGPAAGASSRRHGSTRLPRTCEKSRSPSNTTDSARSAPTPRHLQANVCLLPVRSRQSRARRFVSVPLDRLDSHDKQADPQVTRTWRVRGARRLPL